jgi:uncharacterized protein (TIRG00374 family)
MSGLARKYSVVARWIFPAILAIYIVYGLVYGIFRDFFDTKYLTIIIFCLFGYLFILVLNAVRWVVVIRIYGVRLGLRLSFLWTLIGHFFNQVLPTSVGGDAVRIWQAARQIPLRFAVSSVVVERLVGLIALLLLISAGLPFVFFRFELGQFLIVCGFVLFFVAGMGCFIFFDRNNSKDTANKLVSIIKRTIFDARDLFKNPLILIISISISVVMHVINTLIAILVSRKLGADVNIVDIMLIMPSVMLVSSLPISIGGWGVREAGLALGFSMLGQPVAIAVATSIIIGLANLVSGLPGALAWALMPRAARYRAGRPLSEALDPPRQTAVYEQAHGCSPCRVSKEGQ